MNIPISASPVGPSSTVQRGAERRILLHHISWQDYEALGEILKDRPRLRLTYDSGSLEIMTTPFEHEHIKERLSRFVQTLAEEFGLEVAPGGNMTFRKVTLAKGLEGDSCFWIQHEPEMRMLEEWDPSRHPPPDLVIEVEISPADLNRMDLYAALGVPEVWRCDSTKLHVHLLQPDRTYLVSETSPTFPGLPIPDIIIYLQPVETMGFLALVRAFRDWVRQQRSST